MKVGEYDIPNEGGAEPRDEIIILEECALDLLGRRLALCRRIQSQIGALRGLVRKLY
jgi:hypothetical protein